MLHRVKSERVARYVQEIEQASLGRRMNDEATERLIGRARLNHELDGVMTCRQLPEGLERGPNVFGGQAIKSIRWMPWHQEAMKDVVKLR